MASNVIRVSILADAKNFQGGFKEAERAGMAFGVSVATLAKGVGAALAIKAAQAVKDFVSDAREAYSNLEQATGAMETVFGQFADTIEDESKRAADSVGLSESAYKTLAARLGGMLQNIGYSVEESTGEVINLIEVGADLAATYGGTVADAVNAIASLLRGERDPIEQYAVSMKEADVQARAMAMGLAESNSELTNHDKAMASLDILYEQAAKARGQFARETDTAAGREARMNARLDDAKAAWGALFEPMARVFDEMKGRGIGILADVAEWLGRITGAVSEADHAVRQYNDTIAEGGSQAEGLAQAYGGLAREWASQNMVMGKGQAETRAEIKETTDALVKQMGGWQNLLSALDAGAEALGLSEQEYEHLTREIKAQKAAFDENIEQTAMKEQRDRAVAQAAEDAANAVDDTTDALENQADTLRALSDPMFGAIKASRDLKTAQNDYNRAVEEYGEDSDEAIDALEGMVDANGDLMDSLGRLRTQGIDPTGEKARKMFKDIGLTDAQINAIFRQFDQVESNFESRIFKLTAQAPMIDYRQSGNKIVPQPAGGRYFHEGGRVPGLRGQDVPIIAQGGEEVLSATEAERQRGGAAGPTTVINITVEAGVSDPYQVGRKIVELIQQYNRIAGGADIEVRTL